MNPEEVERVIGSISEKDVMSFARRKLWDQDVAVSAVGSIEGVSLFHDSHLTYNFGCRIITLTWTKLLDYNRIRNDMSRNA